MVILLVFVSVLVIGLLVAVPVWTTQIQREDEEELIFRGGQYVEAIRLYQQKNPGQFPKDVEELIKKRFLRKAFRDPMTKEGKWYLITQEEPRLAARPRTGAGSAAQGGRQAGQPAGQADRQAPSLLLVPEDAAAGMGNLRILGVASMSPRDSIRVYNDSTKYAEWLFYFGQDPNVKPDVAIYGRDDEK